MYIDIDKYSLEELKIGMEVQLSQLTKITGVAFVIIERIPGNYKPDEYKDIIGKIVYIGNPFGEDSNIFADWLMDAATYNTFAFCIDENGSIIPIEWEEPRYEDWYPEEDEDIQE